MPTLEEQVASLYADYPIQPYISPERDLVGWLDAVRIGKEKLVPRRNLELTAEGLTAGDIILLWRVGFGTFTTESWFPKYFEYTYGIDGESRLQVLIHQGYVRQETALESLDHVTMPFLKSLLKEKGVKGLSKLKRVDVEAVMLEQFTEESLASTFSVRGYALTTLGEQVLESHAAIVERHPKKQF